MWKSSKHPNLPDSLSPEFANRFLDWHVDSTPQEDHLSHGAQEKHFEGLHKLTIYYEKSLHVMSSAQQVRQGVVTKRKDCEVNASMDLFSFVAGQSTIRQFLLFGYSTCGRKRVVSAIWTTYIIFFN